MPQAKPNIKKRHGCLTALLVVIIIGNAFAMLTYLTNKEVLTSTVLPDWAPTILSIMSLLNVIFAVGLLRLKKWAFWGFLGSTVILCILNFSLGTSASHSVAGLLGFALLYGVLHLGRENNGWKQLD